MKLGGDYLSKQGKAELHDALDVCLTFDFLTKSKRTVLKKLNHNPEALNLERLGRLMSAMTKDDEHPVWFTLQSFATQHLHWEPDTGPQEITANSYHRYDFTWDGNERVAGYESEYDLP